MQIVHAKHFRFCSPIRSNRTDTDRLTHTDRLSRDPSISMCRVLAVCVCVMSGLRLSLNSVFNSLFCHWSGKQRLYTNEDGECVCGNGFHLFFVHRICCSSSLGSRIYFFCIVSLLICFWWQTQLVCRLLFTVKWLMTRRFWVFRVH